MARSFSGESSRPLWNLINDLSKVHEKEVAEKSSETLYLLGCYCQELELRVDKLELLIKSQKVNNRIKKKMRY